MSNENANNEKLDPVLRKVMIVSTICICSAITLWIFLVPHPEQTKAWRASMALEDCNHLASYLINMINPPNYTKIGSDNVQFVYDTYKSKNCTTQLGWSP